MNPVQAILILAVRVYRCVLSPLKTTVFGPMGRCRFEPSCSAYAAEALQTHGAIRGSWLSLRRVCRCNPWGGCGHDPVPERGPREGKGGYSKRNLNVVAVTLRGVEKSPQGAPSGQLR